MSEKSPNLNLPYILAAQAQKHVTHNEAIRNLDALTQLSLEDKDLTAPPGSPPEGAAYIVAPGGTGQWAGHDQAIAAWQDGAWAFYEPQQGWIGWLRDEDTQVVYNGSTWENLASGGGSTNFNPATGGLVGINAQADTTNRLSVNSPASLFNHNGTDHQLKINKSTVTDNASVIFQTGFSGRAEFGITGNDDFHMKVSPDGTTFHEGIVIDKDTGAVTFPNTTFSGGAVSSVFGRAGAVVATTGDYDFDQISGVSQNALIGRVSTGTGEQEALTPSQVRALLNVEEGASADQTGSEIKTELFGQADTNNFDDDAQSKLANIEPNADITNVENVIASLDGATITSATLAANDKILLQDTSDVDALKTTTAQEIADLAGDVYGQASSTDFGIALFDGPTGKVIKELDAGSSGQFLKTQGSGLTPVWESLAGGGDLLASNNLSDVANAATARSNLGLEIGVDVAAPGAPSGMTTDLLALSLRVADLEGDALGIEDGIVDPFDDETGVDTASSSNQIYDDISDLYKPDAAINNEIDETFTGSVSIGNYTIRTVMAAVQFSNSGNQLRLTLQAGSGSLGGTKVYFGEQASSGNDYDFAGPPTQITFDGGNASTGTLGPNATKLSDIIDFDFDHTKNYVFALYSPSNGSTAKMAHANFDSYTKFGDDAATVNATGYSALSSGNDLCIVKKLEIFGQAMDMTVVANPFSADSTPTTARLLFQIKPINAITLNTDVIGAISRDGGSTFTNATLVEKITYSDGTKLYEATSTDLTGQPAGTSLKWKLTTANSKSIECSGVVLQWS